MNVDFKFELGDEVATKESDRKGIVKTRKYEESIVDGKVIPLIRYHVDFGLYSFNWYDEFQLVFANDKDLKVSPETEKLLTTYALQNVINNSLDLKDETMFLSFAKQLNELEKGKVAE
jgi:hypothetical protein